MCFHNVLFINIFNLFSVCCCRCSCITFLTLYFTADGGPSVSVRGKYCKSGAQPVYRGISRYEIIHLIVVKKGINYVSKTHRRWHSVIYQTKGSFNFGTFPCLFNINTTGQVISVLIKHVYLGMFPNR